VSGYPLLDAARLRAAFGLLDRALARRRVKADVLLYGGAAMLLAYDADRSTRDADSVFRPDGPVLEAAAEVADELGLGRGWLNQQASVYLPPAATTHERAVFDRPVHDGPNLRVTAMNPRYLLAMKVHASRGDQDVTDIGVLADALGLADATEVLAVAQDVYGDEPLPARSRPAVETALERRGGERGRNGS
jgi:hypothetical protein